MALTFAETTAPESSSLGILLTFEGANFVFLHHETAMDFILVIFVLEVRTGTLSHIASILKMV